MCKHKSGGMSKPSGGANEQGALTGGSAPCPSHSCPTDSSATVASTTHTNSIQNPLETKTDLLIDSQVSTPVTMAITAPENEPSGEEQQEQAGMFHPYGVNSGENLENHGYLPSIIQRSALPIYADSQDSDEEVATEQSPMLLSHTYPICCIPTSTWSPSVSSTLKLEEASQKSMCFMESDDCISRCEDNIQVDSYAVSCDKISSFRSYKALNSYQVPTSYIPPCGSGGCTGLLDSVTEKVDETEDSLAETSCAAVLGRRWLYSRHKCKSLDNGDSVVSIHNSAACCRNSVVECSFNEPKMSGIAEELSSTTSSNSCLTATYSSSTVNSDPVAGPSGLQRPSSVHWEIGAKDDKDEDFRCRSYSLTPTINFAVFEAESSSETDDVPDSHLQNLGKLNDNKTISTKGGEDAFHVPVSSISKVIPISPSAAQLSLASSYGDSGAPICKICHMTAKENDPLISPCRCSGTMQYIHCGCLMRWLEISSKRSRKPASCELCQYQYHWHKKFKVRHWQFPRCSRRDKILHFLFIISVLVMIACATITIMCFKQDKGTKVDPDRTELTQSEIVTLVCGVLFFLAFFVAMYVEVKSRNTIYKLLVKFIYLNQQWYIDEYEKKETAPVAV